LQRMKPDNYVREDDDDNLSVGQMSFLGPVWIRTNEREINRKKPGHSPRLNDNCSSTHRAGPDFKLKPVSTVEWWM
jgi:hypothetical protein